jgi:tRNA modification GTPase
LSDTIFALSTASGRAGIAIVRVSGPQAKAALVSLSGREDFPPRQAIRARLSDAGGHPLDDALVLWFPGPASFSGEDIAEFHLHGGRSIIDAVLRALSSLPGLRPSEPGEFTRRAVRNGKLDLTRAEGLADLIDAETESQRLQALRQYDGAFARLCDGWRDRLIKATAWVEAAIDFADEELPEETVARSSQIAGEILKEIQDHLTDSQRGEIIRNGVHLTVFGPVNAGKSSLINALARRDVAIVSPTPGTTRDVIEVHLDLGGYAVIASDTAGLRPTEEAVEAEGVRRALDRARSADLTLLLLDGARPDTFTNYQVEPDLVVWNKADVEWSTERDGIRISAKTGEGLDFLIESLVKIIAQRLDVKGDSVPITRTRHRHALEQAVAALTRSLNEEEAELMAEDLRLTLREIGRVTGRVDIEDLLDVVFRDFCIGK